MLIDVSAMLVVSTTLRAPDGDLVLHVARQVGVDGDLRGVLKPRVRC